MTFAAAALLGLTMGQPLGPDYHALNSRNIKLPIEYKKDRKTIRQVTLYVSRGENTWYQEGFVTPDKDAFVYVAKDDGIYWFKMQIEDLKGNKDPADLTRDPPDLKMVVDTTPPQIRVTNGRRTGQEIVIEWAVDDKFANDAATKVQFRATDNPKAEWVDVQLHPSSRNGVKFSSGISDGVTVKITAADFAGNRTEIVRDIPAGNAGASTSLKEQPVVPAPAPMNMGNVAVAATPSVGPAAPVGPDPLPPAPPANQPIAAQPTPPVSPPSYTPIMPYTPPAENPAAPAAGSQPLVSNPPATNPPQGGGGLTPLPTTDPKHPPVRPAQGMTPVAWNTGAPTTPTVEMSRAQAINYARFDLGYDLEKHGPSGISRVDLWVTRDDGKSWKKWSQHDGKGGKVHVALDGKESRELFEGGYGFKLVPVSGAGLSEREPTAGDAPDMRVVLDVTAPQVELFLPQPNPNAPPPPDTLVIQWKATDRNFGDDPVTLEWSDAPTGPWKPVAATNTDPVVQATGVNAPIAKRLASTGQYAWRVPAGVPARVYLKATARDAAGNITERVTTEAHLVDLTTPRAKISGIVPPTAVRP